MNVVKPGKSLKEQAMDFLRLASSGQVANAYDLYVAKEFTHHNPYYNGDRESLKKGMEENANTHPNKEFKMLLTIQEGDVVAVHSRVHPATSELPFSVVHLFRFKENRIVELWDVIMPQPKEMINENGLF